MVIQTQRLDFVKRAFILLHENNIALDKSVGKNALHYASGLAPHNSQSANADDHDQDTDMTSNVCAILEYLLLEQGFNVNCTTKDIWTPLHYAACAGNIKTIQCLIKHGADVMARCTGGLIPLHRSTVVGNKEVVQCLIEHGADVMARDTQDRTPLHIAAIYKRKEVIQCLIKHGADVMARDKEGTYPWMNACYCEKEYCEIMAEMLDGVDLKQKLHKGMSLLHPSCVSGSICSARYLLQNGADVNCTDENNLTPLFVMCMNQDVSRILNSGLAQEGEEVYHSHRIEKMVKDVSRRRQFMKLLLDSGADVNHRDKNGHTLLMKIKIYKQRDIREFLIEHCADLNAVGMDGLTVLWTAIEYDCEAEFYLIDSLLARNIDIRLSKYKHEGITPLQLAYSKGNDELCDILLNAGCSLHNMLEFMDANINLESDENMQGVRSRIVELSSQPHYLRELSRQAVLRGMGSGNLVMKVICMQDEEILPKELLNFLLRNLSQDPWFD